MITREAREALLLKIDAALSTWERAANGDSSDAEYEAGLEMADLLRSMRDDIAEWHAEVTS